MKFWLLTILFITTEGEHVLVDGWHPTNQPSKEVCEERLNFLNSYMEKQPIDPYVGYVAECKEYSW